MYGRWPQSFRQAQDISGRQTQHQEQARIQLNPCYSSELSFGKRDTGPSSGGKAPHSKDSLCLCLYVCVFESLPEFTQHLSQTMTVAHLPFLPACVLSLSCRLIIDSYEHSFKSVNTHKHWWWKETCETPHIHFSKNFHRSLPKSSKKKFVPTFSLTSVLYFGRSSQKTNLSVNVPEYTLVSLFCNLQN